MPLQMNFSLLTPAKQVEKFRSSHLAYWWRTLGNQDTRSPRQTDDPCIQIPPAAELGVYIRFWRDNCSSQRENLAPISCATDFLWFEARRGVWRWWWDYWTGMVQR